jgi:hypothetical protein
MDEAVKRVIETSCPIAEIARDIHVNEETLRNWVHKYRAVHVDDEPALSVSERARLRELGTDNPSTGWTVRWSPFFRWAGPVVVFAVVAVAPLGLYRAGVHDGAQDTDGRPCPA